MGTPYSFGYSTADGQSRQESGAGGAVQGSYSYVDANGDLRQVRAQDFLLLNRLKQTCI